MRRKRFKFVGDTESTFLSGEVVAGVSNGRLLYSLDKCIEIGTIPPERMGVVDGVMVILVGDAELSAASVFIREERVAQVKERAEEALGRIAGSSNPEEGYSVLEEVPGMLKALPGETTDDFRPLWRKIERAEAAAGVEVIRPQPAPLGSSLGDALASALST